MRLDNPPKMKVLRASIRYGSFFTDAEREKLERYTEHEQPLITIHDDRLWVAFDRADTVFEFPLTRLAAIPVPAASDDGQEG